MKSWSYGMNGYKRTAHIFLDEGPFYLFILGWIVDTVDEVLSFLEIPLPKIAMRLKDLGDIEDNDGKEWTTWYDQYGYWCCLYSLFIWSPVWAWITKRMVGNRVIEVPYDKMRELFYEDDKKWWDNEEEAVEEMRKEEKNK